MNGRQAPNEMLTGSEVSPAPILPGTSGMSKILLGPGPHHSLVQWFSAYKDQASFPMGSGFFQGDIREQVPR